MDSSSTPFKPIGLSCKIVLSFSSFSLLLPSRLGADLLTLHEELNLSNTWFCACTSFSYVLLRLSSSCSVKRSAPNLEGSNSEKLEKLKTILQDSPIGLKGVEELSIVFDYLKDVDIRTEIKLDLTLARGLSYYTGAIFEVKALDVQIGSITGGGRYDDLTGIFGLKNMSGVGISFGADRIFDVMNQLDLFPKDNMTTTQILFVNFGKQEERYCLPLLKQLREAGINAEIYPEAAKMKKQMTYADKKEIPFVALIGENEMQEGIISLKNMLSGEQHNVTMEELVERLKR